MSASNKKSYFQLVKEAILAIKDRSGSSPQAIKAWITTSYPAVAFQQHHLRAALKKGVADGKLVKTKNSFKLGAEEKKAKPTVKKPVKKAVVKKTPVKKAAAPKKAAASKKVATEKAAPKKKATPKKKALTKKVYFHLVKEAILAIKDRSGSSPQAIKAWITTSYPAVAFQQHHLRAALKKGVAEGKLVKTKNSFKLGAEEKKAKPTVKKAAAAKKAVAKKTPVKKAAAPKKAAASKKVATEKAAPKKKATPKKKAPVAKKVAVPKKSPAKKPAVKKAAAPKKSPAKKVGAKPKAPKAKKASAKK
eukprot:CAMPEP_0182437430 /NCGR_PEP_ID=MMETSP1167-20130531/85037_1 /TAXON_ID=2988 /ORGANISM="Mallomonas Sp, Strain CCMP3275" /LENGTH=304 /DNA_ID=CAMNT_0024630339 /DNA_START=59 /DNA_END=972 /DNA_ORIENTATION=-